jgi:hypothetical protein
VLLSYLQPRVSCPFLSNVHIICTARHVTQFINFYSATCSLRMVCNV